MSATPYTNQLHSRNIRLIRILPGDPDNPTGPVKRLLTEVSLQDPPPYEALSYVWGDPEVTERMLCNGVSFNVTANLASALQRLRRSLKPLKTHSTAVPATLLDDDALSTDSGARGSPLLWVDAICIHQQDVAERNHQVSLMKDIYSGATRVLVWLEDRHPREDEIEKAVATIKYVSLEKLNFKFRSYEIAPGDSLTDLERKIRERDLRSNWLALNVVFSSQWYDRVWCIQEVALARETMMLFNDNEVEGKDVARLCMWYTEFCKSDSPPTGFYYLSHRNLYKMQRRLHTFNRSSSPLSVLQWFREKRAKDPRDNIYGLLGLMTEKVIQADYTKSTSEVFVDTVLELIVHDKDLSVLSHVHHPSSFDESIHLSSFAPRWDLPGITVMCPPSYSQIFAGCRRAPLVNIAETKEGAIGLRGLLCDDVHIVKTFWESEMWEMFERPEPPIVRTVRTLTGGRISIDRCIDELDSDAGKRFLSNFSTFLSGSADELDIKVQNEIETLLGLNIEHRQLFRTKRSWAGLGPKCMRNGDIVVVFTGGAMPFILRPANNGKDQYYLMGECYIYDIAMGQAYDILGKEGVEERILELI
ncbi:hypothetical protein EKO04_003195 [Ascochyta lentis]|uniref:Heterokaryon incompatibility domain-containing protein n=1 Tax=Ascochyta lentis TaxID=205686 RepID=A0A8H7J6S9_9PLEO|nr:hypothetical protein EKO04_003195 [Ascochyta lentis]